MKESFSEIKKLALLANRLDSCGLYEEADVIDVILKKYAQLPISLLYLADRAGVSNAEGVAKIINQMSGGDYLGLALDIAGLIPGVGEAADVASFIKSCVEQDWVDVLLDAIGLVPELGTWIKTTVKLTKRIPFASILKYSSNILNLISKVIDSLISLSKAKYIAYATNISDIVSKVKQAYSYVNNIFTNYFSKNIDIDFSDGTIKPMAATGSNPNSATSMPTTISGAVPTM